MFGLLSLYLFSCVEGGGFGDGLVVMVVLVVVVMLVEVKVSVGVAVAIVVGMLYVILLWLVVLVYHLPVPAVCSDGCCSEAGFLKIVEIYRCLSRTYTYGNFVFLSCLQCLSFVLCW